MAPELVPTIGQLITIKGNLLTSDCDVILHQANCQGVMGSGIALEIRKLYPEAYEAFIRDVRRPKEKLGSYSCARTRKSNKLIYNVYSQFHYLPRGVRHTDYDALRRALIQIFEEIKKFEPEDYRLKVGIPFGYGSDRGGGKWENVLEIFQDIAVQFKHDIFIYKL